MIRTFICSFMIVFLLVAPFATFAQEPIPLTAAEQSQANAVLDVLSNNNSTPEQRRAALQTLLENETISPYRVLETLASRPEINFSELVTTLFSIETRPESDWLLTASLMHGATTTPDSTARISTVLNVYLATDTQQNPNALLVLTEFAGLVAPPDNTSGFLNGMTANLDPTTTNTQPLVNALMQGLRNVFPAGITPPVVQTVQSNLGINPQTSAPPANYDPYVNIVSFFAENDTDSTREIVRMLTTVDPDSAPRILSQLISQNVAPETLYGALEAMASSPNVNVAKLTDALLSNPNRFGNDLLAMGSLMKGAALLPPGQSAGKIGSIMDTYFQAAPANRSQALPLAELAALLAPPNADVFSFLAGITNNVISFSGDQELATALAQGFRNVYPNAINEDVNDAFQSVFNVQPQTSTPPSAYDAAGNIARTFGRQDSTSIVDAARFLVSVSPENATQIVSTLVSLNPENQTLITEVLQAILGEVPTQQDALISALQTLLLGLGQDLTITCTQPSGLGDAEPTCTISG